MGALLLVKARPTDEVGLVLSERHGFQGSTSTVDTLGVLPCPGPGRELGLFWTPAVTSRQELLSSPVPSFAQFVERHMHRMHYGLGPAEHLGRLAGLIDRGFSTQSHPLAVGGCAIKETVMDGTLAPLQHQDDKHCRQTSVNR